MTVNKQLLLKINLHYRNKYDTRLPICQKKFKTCKNYKNQTEFQLQLIIKTKLISSSLNVTVLSYQMWFKYSKQLTSSWADESWCDLFPSSSSSESSSPDESPEPPRSFTSAKQMTIFKHTNEHI